MPITYEIDPDRRLIVTRCIGNTGLTEVLEHFEQLINDPNCPPVLNVLLDLTEMTAVPDSGQLHVAAAATARASRHVQFDHCAIVAASEPTRGLAMVWQMFAQQSFRAAETFRTPEEARAWLASAKV
ncbi:MAG TPA: STAS/SEC14 domain-containing protein [Gemmatimonadales bacterium]|nr:STAS/SEC14 domain-containing protein [Gemmatimonadales bacterium]